MSSRAVRRLLKERGYDDLAETAARVENKAQQAASAEADSGSEEEMDGTKPVQANMFDLLMEDGGSPDTDNDSNADEEESAAQGTELSQKQPTSQMDDRISTTKKKGKGGNKKRGKGKRGGKAVAAADMSMAEFEAQLKEHSAHAPAATADEKSIREDGSGKSNAGRGGALGVVLTEEQQRNRALLVVEAKYLSSEAEIRRLFGSAALKDSGGRGGGGRRRFMQRAIAKRSTLAQPKPTWPPMLHAPGVEMRQLVEADEDKEMQQIISADPTGGQWFTIEHSTRFRTVQLEFLQAVITNDADSIAALAHHHPYHVDALLQLSEILKQTGGDFGEAGTLVEQALFAFEQGFAARFSVTNGMGRLDFRRIESRGLFLALFRHMQFMARRGCWRTALEVNKVLLGLDPVHDPYGVLLTLDFFALKSRQYEYVRRFVADWSWSRVDLLPNWAYSQALAEFMLESGDGKKGKKSESRASMDLLVEAILAFPTVVPILWTKAGVDVDPVVLTHPYFEDVQIPDESAMTCMQLMVQMFAERNSALYRTPEVGRWLQEGLLLALERIALGGTDERDISASMAVVTRKQQAQKKLCTYVVPENISRHVLVADMDAIKAGLPEEIRKATSFAFDPLPPHNDINIYDDLVGGSMERAHRLRMPGAFGAVDDEELDAAALPEIRGILERLRARLGDWGDELDPGTSSDEEDLGTGNNDAAADNEGP
ncbi:hypothetical protein H4R20_005877 [Coemansia guatemalensis]|uniref:DUF654-domain-containing protein n=1 Tax=Coemansia guatemalensis TaxID=2761395 RepID=A0A9W8HQK8_9FUNG|nr:hypothetical protein H4R20_005877 [Coemansia guatemalensis]